LVCCSKKNLATLLLFAGFQLGRRREASNVINIHLTLAEKLKDYSGTLVGLDRVQVSVNKPTAIRGRLNETFGPKFTDKT
jgi:hypothetical protein